MKLKIDDLRKSQDELNQRIFALHNRSYDDSINDRLLALLTELGELANETRCFKYWSEKEASSTNKILEEYSDGLHFLISAGIDLDDESETIESITEFRDLTEQFLTTFEVFCNLTKHYDLDHYHKAFANYLGLADILGFEEEQLRKHYLAKNRKNHKRQDEHY